MVISKSKGSKSSEKTVTKTTTTSSGTQGGGSRGNESFTTVASQNLPMLQEKMAQKASSIVHSSSSSKVSSSQKQEFISTSSTSSNSQGIKSSSQTQQLQSQSDAFLRGERILGDIDSKRTKNGSIIIDSVNLQNISSDAVINSGLNNLVSVEIESKDSYAHRSSNSSEFVTNTSSTFSSSGGNVENRNDVINVESGKSTKEKTATSATTTESGTGDRNSLIQGSNAASSSSTYQEFSSSSMASSNKENNETKSAVSKNVSSSKTMKSVDGKNLADSTTTFTSKVYDDKSKTWVVVDQSSVNEKDIILPGGVGGGNSTTRSSIIDNNNATMSGNNNFISTSSDNTANTAAFVDKNSSSSMMNMSNKNTAMSSTTSSDVKMNSKSTKEVLEKNMSSKKESNRNEKITSTTSSETIQVFDSKSKSWITVDAGSFDKQKRPSYVRYRSQDDDGKWHTIYKRKLFDEFTKQWRIVDEKVISSDDGITRLGDIPEMIENATNMTTTTYTTKVYDTKTGKWTIIDEKSFTDTDSVNVTQDIKREIEKDQPDLANVITTTETTKVFIFLNYEFLIEIFYIKINNQKSRELMLLVHDESLFLLFIILLYFRK